MTAPLPDPIHDALTAAEQAIAALWPARGVEPDVPDLGPTATADRVLALVGVLEHLAPIVRQVAEQAGDADPMDRLAVLAVQLRSTSAYLTALQHPDRPRS